MLNPELYAALVKRFGEVRVANEGLSRIVDDRTNQVVQRGEQYIVCCPFCHDERFRLTVSYRWLSRHPVSKRIDASLINCFNERCKEVHTEEFYQPIDRDVYLAKMGLLDVVVPDRAEAGARTQKAAIPLPEGCVPLGSLSDDHPAITFVQKQYPGLWRPGIVTYLSEAYGAQYCEEGDTLFPRAGRRIIFPITKDRKPYGWQGRTIDPDGSPRWFLPPGLIKILYNLDQVPPYEVPILSEGILNAIACGPHGIAMFGSSVNTILAKELGSRFDEVVLATDPDTFVPNYRGGKKGQVSVDDMTEILAEHLRVRKIRWPKELLDIARKYNKEEIDKCPDAADLGFAKMRRLIKEAT